MGKEGHIRRHGWAYGLVLDSAPAKFDIANTSAQPDDVRDAFARGTYGQPYKNRASGNNAQKR